LKEKKLTEVSTNLGRTLDALGVAGIEDEKRALSLFEEAGP
jgi:hypothetical protein